jgi:hypothetical protein
MWELAIKLHLLLTLAVAGDNLSVFHSGCLYLAFTKQEAGCDRKSLLLLLIGILHSTTHPVQHITDQTEIDYNYDSSQVSMIRPQHSIFNIPQLSQNEHKSLPVAH